MSAWHAEKDFAFYYTLRQPLALDVEHQLAETVVEI